MIQSFAFLQFSKREFTKNSEVGSKNAFNKSNITKSMFKKLVPSRSSKKYGAVLCKKGFKFYAYVF